MLHHARTAHGMAVAVHVPPEEDHHAAVVLVLPYGFSHEPQDAWGAASLGAAMLDRGAGLVTVAGRQQRLDPDALTSWMQQRGITIQTHPGPDHVLLELEAPEEFVEAAVQLACALTFEPQWDEDAYEDAALDTAQHQAEMYASGAALAQQVAHMVLFNGHVLARPMLPPPQEYPPLDTVLAFWKRLARPEHALLLVSTHAPQAALQGAQRCRATAPATPPRDPPRLDHATPNPAPRRLGVVGPPGTTAHVLVTGHAPPAGTMDLAALAAALETLGNGFSSVLVQRLRTQLGLVYGVEATWQHARAAGVWTISTSTGAQHVRRVLDVVDEVLAGVDRDGVDPAHWARMARATALPFAQGAEDPLSLLAMEADHFRLGRPPGHGWRFPRLLWEAQPQQAARVAQAILSAPGRVLVVVAPATAWDSALRASVDAVVPPP